MFFNRGFETHQPIPSVCEFYDIIVNNAIVSMVKYSPLLIFSCVLLPTKRVPGLRIADIVWAHVNHQLKMFWFFIYEYICTYNIGVSQLDLNISIETLRLTSSYARCWRVTNMSFENNEIKFEIPFWIVYSVDCCWNAIPLNQNRL